MANSHGGHLAFPRVKQYLGIHQVARLPRILLTAVVMRPGPAPKVDGDITNYGDL